MRFFGANNNGAEKIEVLKNIPIFPTLTRIELLEVENCFTSAPMKRAGSFSKRAKWAMAFRATAFRCRQPAVA